MSIEQKIERIDISKSIIKSKNVLICVLLLALICFNCLAFVSLCLQWQWCEINYCCGAILVKCFDVKYQIFLSHQWQWRHTCAVALDIKLRWWQVAGGRHGQDLVSLLIKYQLWRAQDDLVTFHHQHQQASRGWSSIFIWFLLVKEIRKELIKVETINSTLARKLVKVSCKLSF